jgi:hypothetical protein
LAADIKLTPADARRATNIKRRIARTPKVRGGVAKASLAPEVAKLRSEGYTVPQIAKMIGRSDRYVRDLFRYARENTDGDGLVMMVPDARGPSEMADEFRSMVDPISVEGFERFFSTFSGRVFPEHAREWVSVAIEHKRLLLNVPPRHAKSTILTVWFTLYLVCADRNIQILLISQTAALAKKFTNEISAHMEMNQALIEAFGRFRPELTSWPWRPNSGELMVDGRTRETQPGDLTIQVRGAGQQILGMEADWIIVDDPENPEIARSEAAEEDLDDWFHEQVITRLEPGSHIIVVGQRVHLKDLYGKLAAKRKTRVPDAPLVWKTVMYPAVLEWPSEGTEAKVLWPERWPFEELMARYEDIGFDRFSTMYQQDPLPEGSRLIQEAWIRGDDRHQGCLDHDREAGTGMPREGLLPVARVLSIDPSPTRYAGLVVADVPYTRENFAATILEMRSEKMDNRTMNEHVRRVIAQYDPDYFVLETNIAHFWMQTPEFEQLKSLVRLIPHSTSGRARSDPEYGVQSLAVDHEMGRIRFPYGDAEARSMTDRYLTEAYNWPQADTDDILMALWFIKFRYRSLIPYGSLPTRQGNPDPKERPHAGWAAFARA